MAKNRSAPKTGATALPLPGEAGAEPDTRARIVATAFRLFHEQGYNNTGVATILREAQVNVGSLYHFFDSKETLLVAVLEYALLILRPAVIDPAERRSEDPLERVFELLQQYREGLLALGCRMGCPIGNLALEVADDHPQIRRLIHENFLNWTRAVQAWLDAAGPRLPARLDRPQLARFVLTVLEGGIMQARAAGDLTPFDDSVAQLRAYFSALQQLARKERGARAPRKLPPRSARSRRRTSPPSHD
ncbi:MAG: TetR/AcrR family transcriptional regulator [Planctomycetales bacterium]